MRNRLVVMNIAIKTFGGFALSQKTTKITSCTTRARPKLSQGCDWLKGYREIQKNWCNLLNIYNRFFFAQWNQSFRTSIDALSFGGYDNHNDNIWWLENSAKTIKQRRCVRTSCDGRDWPKNGYRHTVYSIIMHRCRRYVQYTVSVYCIYRQNLVKLPKTDPYSSYRIDAMDGWTVRIYRVRILWTASTAYRIDGIHYICSPYRHTVCGIMDRCRRYIQYTVYGIQYT